VPDRPRAPFDAWPVQAFDPAFGYAWYARPAALVMQASVEHGTARAVGVLHDFIDRALAAREGEVRAAGGLLIVHDWRAVRGYDREAGAAFAERVGRRDPGYLRRAVVVVQGGRALLYAAVEGVAFLAAVAPDARVEIVADLEILREEKLVPPGPGEPFPAP
jgi:hypothetical protein